MKITTLTDAQIARMPEWVDKWVRIGLSTDRVDFDSAERAVRKCYEVSSLDPPRIVLRMGSPFGATLGGIMAAFMLAHDVRSQVGSEVRSQVESQVRSEVRSQVESQVGSEVRSQVERQVRSQVESQVESQVWRQVESQVESQVRSEVRSQVRSEVRRQVESQVRSQVERQVRSQVRSEVRRQVESQVWSQVWRQVESQVESQVGSEVRSQVERQVRSEVRSQVESQVESQVRRQVESQVESQVRSEVRRQVESQVESQVGSEVRSQVESQVRSEVRRQVESQVESQVWRQVESQVERQVRSEVRRQVESLVGHIIYQYRGCSLWAAWYAYVTFFRDVCGWEDTSLSAFSHDEALACNAGWSWWHHDVCAISDRPDALHVNTVGQLHCASGPALAYPDGWSIWALNGVRVPEVLVMTRPEDLDARTWVLKQSNAEIRREAVRKIGIERVCVQLGARTLEACERRGLPYELLSLDLGDGRQRPYLRMRNPSTGTWHIEGAPPECRTVDEALHAQKPDGLKRIPIDKAGAPWWQQGDVFIWPKDATAVQEHPAVLT